MEEVKEMGKAQTFIAQNFKSIAIVFGFLIGLYIQHQSNISKIERLEQEIARLDGRLDTQYSKLDNMKLDKSVFEATVKQLATMSEDIREIRRSLEDQRLYYDDKRR